MSKRTEDLEKQIAELESLLVKAKINQHAAIARLDVMTARMHTREIDSLTRRLNARRESLAELQA
jgi:hypothetical protein